MKLNLWDEMKVMSDNIKTAWVSNRAPRTEKPWGHETSWGGSLLTTYGKMLFIKEGCRTSLKYNIQKNEMLFLQKGKAKVEYGDERTVKNTEDHPYKIEIMTPGACLSVQSHCPYRITAITDCHFIEIGDRHGDSVVRLDDDFGRK